MNKFDRFWDANRLSGDVVTAVAGDYLSPAFGKYGTFQIDNADIILLVSKLEVIAPELVAVTWMNETTFRFYSEPNTNGRPDDFDKWDVGPMQTNVGYTMKDIAVGFIRNEGLNTAKAFGTMDAIVVFDGDPIENLRLGARKLNALGRAEVIGKDKKILLPKVTVEGWKQYDDWTKNRRRAALYTRPDAREARIASYNKYAPMFRKFFEVYSQK